MGTAHTHHLETASLPLPNFGLVTQEFSYASSKTPYGVE